MRSPWLLSLLKNLTCPQPAAVQEFLIFTDKFPNLPPPWFVSHEPPQKKLNLPSTKFMIEYNIQSMMKKSAIALLYGFLLGTKVIAQTGSSEEPSKYSFNYSKIVPGMPENASLGAYGGVTLNTAKGLPNISFDIYTLSKGGVSVPISISYLASGIKYNEVPSAVGMKWSLNAGGSINRSVNGIVDEDFLLNNLQILDETVMDYRNIHVNSHGVQDSLKQMAKGNYDCSLDNYYYNFPGHSGSMYLGKNKQFRPDKEYTRLQVTYTNHLDTFIVKDDLGNTYIFANYTDNSTVYNTGKYNKQALLSFSARVAWKLRKIITATNQEITFDYIPYYYEYMTLDSERWTAYILYAGQVFQQCLGIGAYTIGYNEAAFTTTRFVNTAWLPSKIATDDQEVLFTYVEDTLQPIFKKQLSAIKVCSKITADTVKRFRFNHTGSFLTSFSENDYIADTAVKIWYFDYHGGGSPFADTYSKSRDIFGYYNGASNTGLIANPAAKDQYYPSPLADRKVNPLVISHGVLSKVTYPTGGSSQFVYEYNHEMTGSGEVYAPGIRVRTTWDTDGAGKVYNKKNFYYSGLTGGKSYADMTLVNEPLINLEPTMVGIWYSDPMEETGADQFSYRKVITENEGDGKQGTPRLYEVDYYNRHSELFGGISPTLIKKDIYLNDTLHLQKTTEYTYELIDVDSLRILTYTLRKGKPWLGRYYYENDPQEYFFCPPFNIYQGYDSKYGLWPRLYNLKKVSTKEYISTGDSIINIVENQYYSKPVYLQQTSKITSAGKTASTHYTYPFNYTTGNPAAMASSFIIGPVITEEYRVNNVPKIKKENSYTYNINSFYIPDQQTITDMATNTSWSYEFYDYNARGHILSQGRTQDVKTSYIYGYLDELPIAEVVNADPGAIAYTSFEAGGKGNWNFTGIAAADATAITGDKTYILNGGSLSKTGLNSALVYTVSYWSKGASASIAGTQVGWPRVVNTMTVNGQSWTCYKHQVSGQSTISLTGSITIDEVRLHPQAAMMTTYAYRPLTGLSSTSNNNCRINYFRYDGLGRLEHIRDDKGYILKKVAYKFNGQSGSDLVYYNGLINQVILRNNCDPGKVGTGVIYTIPAGTYISTVSPSEVDAQVQADINTRGQAYANANGSCVVPCDPRTCRFTPGGKCINNVCEIGVRVNTASVFDQLTGKYTCTYHYEYSDNSRSQDLTEENSFGCPGF
jgi:hypothetical protein